MDVNSFQSHISLYLQFENITFKSNDNDRNILNIFII